MGVLQATTVSFAFQAKVGGQELLMLQDKLGMILLFGITPSLRMTTWDQTGYKSGGIGV
jgi:hypothetical protein